MIRASRLILIKILTHCLKQASCKIKGLEISALLAAWSDDYVSVPGRSFRNQKFSENSSASALALWGSTALHNVGTPATQKHRTVTAGRADNTQLVPAIFPCTAQLHTAPSCYSPFANFLHPHLYIPFDAALCHHVKGTALSSLPTQLQSHCFLQGAHQTFSKTLTLV